MYEEEQTITVGFNCLRPITGCINRDENGDPKKMTIDGITRTFVTSYCTKYCLLKYMGIRPDKIESKNELIDIIKNYNEEKDKYKYIQISEKDLFDVLGVTKNSQQAKGGSNISLKVGLKALNLFYNSENKDISNLKSILTNNVSLGIYLTGEVYPTLDIPEIPSLTNTFAGRDVQKSEYTNYNFTNTSDLKKQGCITMGEESCSSYILHYGLSLDVSGMLDSLIKKNHYNKTDAINEVSDFVSVLYKALKEFNYRAKISQFGCQGDGIVHFTIAKNKNQIDFYERAFRVPFPNNTTYEEVSLHLANVMDEYYEKNWGDVDNKKEGVIFNCIHQNTTKSKIKELVLKYIG